MKAQERDFECPYCSTGMTVETMAIALSTGQWHGRVSIRDGLWTTCWSCNGVCIVDGDVLRVATELDVMRLSPAQRRNLMLAPAELTEAAQ